MDHDNLLTHICALVHELMLIDGVCTSWFTLLSDDPRMIALNKAAAQHMDAAKAKHQPLKTVVIRQVAQEGQEADEQLLEGFDYVIMDVGRLPNTHNLGLEEVGVQMGES